MLVLNNDKIAQWKEDVVTMMEQYFSKLDEQESKRFEEVAKSKTAGAKENLKEMGPEDL
jgi:hypothetical protein